MRGGRPKGKPGPEAMDSPAELSPEQLRDKTKFVLMGLDAAQKRVAASRSCGRIYLPRGWVGKRVKIIRLD